MALSTLILLCHMSQLSMALGRSSRLQPAFAKIWSMYVFAGRLILMRQCVGIHKNITCEFVLTSPAMTPCSSWMFCEMGENWPCDWGFVGYCLEDLFKIVWGCPRGVMVKAMDCGIVVSEFILQSRYYVHFRANTQGKVWTPLSS